MNSIPAKSGRSPMSTYWRFSSSVSALLTVASNSVVITSDTAVFIYADKDH